MCTGTGENIHFLNQYDCFIAHFKLCSTEDEKDMEIYCNPVTKKEARKSFQVEDKIHFAVLNTDGTIRDHRLFVGNDLFHIEEVIDLGTSLSLAEYKRKRIELLDEVKRKEQFNFYQSMDENGVYADDHLKEVSKTLHQCKKYRR